MRRISGGTAPLSVVAGTMGPMKIYNWRPFLERWSADWVDSPGERARKERKEWTDADEEVLRERWLGFPAADEDRIAALEERLDVTLPPTYRSFLATTDGWRHAGPFIRSIGTAEDVRRCQEVGAPGGGTSGRPDRWQGSLDAEVRDSALELPVDSEAGGIVLDPGDVNADGEWAAYVHSGRSGERAVRYESFMELMQALFRQFHRANSGAAGFDNETTRELDADVEEARAACLSGADIDEQLRVAEDAEAHGRPGAAELGAEMRAFLRGGGADTSDASDAPRGELPPYEPPGAFGKALTVAREQARWGDTDAAWATVAGALGEWEPYGGERVAPVGLLADPVLGPVITPERGRYVLETPRGEGRTASTSAADPLVPRPDGLTWLAEREDAETADDTSEAASEQGSGSYRFVLVQGVPPEDLVARIGRGPLLPPTDRAGLRPYTAEGASVSRVGTAGEGWSFAFDDTFDDGSDGGSDGGSGAASTNGAETLPPDDGPSALEEAASRGTRSVTVWRRQGGGPAGSPGLFHFSYAEDGRRTYGFTVRGGGIRQWGGVPAALDPYELFPASAEGGTALDPDDEYEALEALAEEFGVSLPSLALTYGRLHAVATADWHTP